jgi:RNA polymerase sigma factor (sigma-70 family)
MISDIHPIIYLVDDDPSIRSSLSLLLESAGYEVICFKSANDVLKYGLDSLTSGCIILDVKMPGISGIELQKELTSHDFDIPIIFITGHGDIPMSVQAIKNGAVNFLAKPFEDNELLDAIDEALLRENESLGKKSEQDQIKQKIDTLTPREDELLRYLITGMLNKQIAYELNISERTVKAHRKQVLKKMGIQSIAELVRLTEKAGIKPIE